MFLGVNSVEVSQRCLSLALSLGTERRRRGLGHKRPERKNHHCRLRVRHCDVARLARRALLHQEEPGRSVQHKHR